MRAPTEDLTATRDEFNQTLTFGPYVARAMALSNYVQDLQKRNTLLFSAYSLLAAFSVYFCMYAFRKPFSAGSYEEYSIGGIDYKIVLIISQVFGYALSKFIGIKIISEMRSDRRILCILLFIGIAETALFFLGIVPPPYNFVFMFLNGLPLGMIWGIVFSFLEGRKNTEALGAGLCASFIISSGVVKSVGRYTITDWGVPEFWMPFVTGLIFTPILLISVFLLRFVPPPSDEDVERRTIRVPMNGSERLQILKQIGGGLTLILVFHMLITAYRDFRDNFAIEILLEIGYGDSAANLARSEIPVAFCVLAALGSLFLIRGNRLALDVAHIVMAAGSALIGLSTWLFQSGSINPYLWFTLVGLGLYLAYVPIQCMLFDRLIAALKSAANIGFFMYIADSTGYLASVAVMLYRNFFAGDQSWLSFFVGSSYVVSIFGASLVILSFAYFSRKLRADENNQIIHESSPA